MNKTLELEKRLGEENKISDFRRDWINESANTEEEMWQVYCVLRHRGFSRDKIASQAHLLGRDPDTIDRNYKRLSKLGLKDSKIATLAHLLGRDPDTIDRNYARLSKLGLKDDKIASQAHLLGMNPDTIDRNYARLSKLGLKDDKIASRADLLGRDPETIDRNYENLISLLRQDYEDRNSGKELVLNQAQLLGNSQETILSNIQYLHNLEINYNDGILLGTTAQLKRKKMAWMLRELFNYRNSQDKRETINELHKFVRENPNYLKKSISVLEKAKPKILEKLAA